MINKDVKPLRDTNNQEETVEIKEEEVGLKIVVTDAENNTVAIYEYGEVDAPIDNEFFTVPWHSFGVNEPLKGCVLDEHTGHILRKTVSSEDTGEIIVSTYEYGGDGSIKKRVDCTETGEVIGRSDYENDSIKVVENRYSNEGVLLEKHEYIKSSGLLYRSEFYNNDGTVNNGILYGYHNAVDQTETRDDYRFVYSITKYGSSESDVIEAINYSGWKAKESNAEYWLRYECEDGKDYVFAPD